MSLIGTKRPKDKNKAKKKKKFKRVNNKKFMTRRDFIIDSISDPFKKLWFNGDKEKMKSFANWLIEQEELMSDIALADTECDRELNKELDKANKPCANLCDVITNLNNQGKIIHKKSKNNKKKIRGSIDTGIATLLNPKTYKKKYLDVAEYRKELKQLAKREQKEMKEAKRLGYGVRKSADELLDEALSDTFNIKHPI